MSFLPGQRLAAAEVRRAQCDAAARERLIERFTPFVLRVTTKVVGRYVHVGQDDEVSVALIAFNEAIDRFDPLRGEQFLAFSELVIRRRLADHYRREAQRREIPLSTLEGDDPQRVQGMLREAETAIAAERELQAELERREEVLRYREALAAFDISFAELLRAAPRHRDTRETALRVAAIVAGRAEFIAHLRQRRSLPLQQLQREVSVSRKTLERHRKYIVAAALALSGDYPYLQTYLRVGGDR